LENRTLLSGGLDSTFGIAGIAQVTSDGKGDENITSLLRQSNGDLIAVTASSALPQIPTANGMPLILVTDPVYVSRYTPAGVLDTSFATAGIFSNTPGIPVAAAAIDSQGRIILAGAEGVARLTANGAIDTTFQSNAFSPASTIATGTLVTGSGNPSQAALGPYNITSIAPEPDGKLLVAADMSSNNSSFLEQLNSDGSIDTSFGQNGQITLGSGLNQVALLPNGKILLAFVDSTPAAGFSEPSVSGIFMSELNSDGTVNTAFGTNGGVEIADTTVLAIPQISVEPDGQILILTSNTDSTPLSFYDFSGAALRAITANGSLDTAFNSGNPIDFQTPHVAMSLDANSRIIVATSEETVGGALSPRVTLHRYNENGQPDSTFGDNGVSGIFVGAADVIENVTTDANDRPIVMAINFPTPPATLTSQWTGGTQILAASTPNGAASTQTSPSATLNPIIPPVADSSSLDFTVTYHDTAGLDLNSIQDTKLQVTGPGTFETTLATFVSSSASTDSSSDAATYQIAAPNSSWNANDNGAYIVALDYSHDTITDANGDPLPTGTIGQFSIQMSNAAPIEYNDIDVGGAVVTVNSGTLILGPPTDPVVGNPPTGYSLVSLSPFIPAPSASAAQMPSYLTNNSQNQTVIWPDASPDTIIPVYFTTPSPPSTPVGQPPAAVIAASLNPPNVVPGASIIQLSVAFTDSKGASPDKLTPPNSIDVTGPDGFSQTATLLPPANSGSGETVLYSYSLPIAPTISSSANGQYTVSLSSAVADTSSDTIPAGPIGTFNIDVPSAAPAFAVTQLLHSPSSVTGGKAATDALTITNFGSQLAEGSVNVKLVLAPQPSSSQSDVEITSLSVPINLNPGKAKHLTVHFNYPTDASTASYYVLAEVDTDEQIAQLDATKSATVSSLIAYTQPVINLSTTIIAPRAISPGKQTMLQVRVSNTGNITTKGPLQFTINSPGIVLSQLLATATRTVDIAPGATKTIDIPLLLSADQSPGDMELFASVEQNSSPDGILISQLPTDAQVSVL
jgi:uncharacterized delta-60 repeat protein